jgi:uncharacterized membrane protein
MYTGLLQIHSYMRYIILLMLVIVIVVSLLGLINKGPFTKKHDKLSLFLFICTHMQLLLGIILYFTGQRVMFNSQTMKEPALRYFAVEHVSVMLIAVVLITLARTGAKKLAIDQQKHKRMFIWNTIALVLIVVTVFVLGGKYNTY